MKKVLVIGCPGSGKSTFSRQLHALTGIPICHLDMLYWNADKTTVENHVFLERLEATLGQDRWIIDGNFSSTMEHRMQICDTVFFLDYPVELCLAGVRQRRGKERPDIPWIETGEDREFIAFIESFHAQRRPQILRLLEKYDGKRIHIFTDRAQADAFLHRLENTKNPL